MSEQKQATSAEANKKINRREFLMFAWLASLGFLTLNVGGMTYLFSLPRFKEGEFGGVFTVGKVSELRPPGSSPANYPRVRFWLSRTPEGVSALYKVCTHLGCLYNWNDQENKFICPCHGSQFLLDGTYVAGPAPRSLDQFKIQIVDPNSGEVLAESNEPGPVAVPENPDAVLRVDTGQRINGKPHG